MPQFFSETDKLPDSCKFVMLSVQLADSRMTHTISSETNTTTVYILSCANLSCGVDCAIKNDIPVFFFSEQRIYFLIPVKLGCFLCDLG